MPGRRSLAVLAFVAVAAFVGCGGETVVHPSCAYSATANSTSFLAPGGSGTLTISTATSCAWTATTDVAWVSLGSMAGTGPTTVPFAVAANGDTATRKASVVVAGQALAIAQDGRVPCSFVVTPTTQSFTSTAATGTVTVTAGGDCNWSVASGAAWLTVTSGQSGTGNGAVSFAIAANAGTGARDAVLTVAGQNVAIRQEAPPSTPDPPKLPTVVCDYVVAPVDFQLHWHGGTSQFTVTTSPGCGWTAAATESWIGLSTSGGAGSATVSVTVPDFTSDATREGAVQVRWPTPTAGQNVWFSQGGCRYGVSQSATSFGTAGGRTQVLVVTQPVSSSCNIGCPWTAATSATWIHITSSMPRSGDDAFFFDVDPNATGAARSGVISVAGRTIVVSQQ
jgi:hypothetical protein